MHDEDSRQSRQDRAKTCLLEIADKDQRIDYLRQAVLVTRQGRRIDCDNLAQWSTSPERGLSCTRSLVARGRRKPGFKLPMIDMLEESGIERKMSQSMDFSSIRRQFTEIQPSIPIRTHDLKGQLNNESHSISKINIILKQPRPKQRPHNKSQSPTINHKTQSPPSKPQPPARSPRHLSPRTTQKSQQLRQYNQQLAIYLNPIIARQMMEMRNPNSKFVSVREAHKRNVRLGRGRN